MQHEGVRKHTFEVILAEYQATRRALLHVTGQWELLDNEPLLQQAIRLRNPYVDPLNLVQVGLLRRYRQLPVNAPERQEVLDALRQSIVSITAGLKNTG